MALIKFSALVSDMRNKLNGSVLAKNKGGNYMRNKTTPVNPQTTAQMAKRAMFGDLSASFRALPVSDIDKWNAAAANFPYLDIFGDSRTLSGSQLYVKLNNNLAQVGVTALTSPPNPKGAGSVVLVSAQFDETAEELNIVQTTVGASTGRRFIYEATAPQSAGVRFFKNKYRQIAVSTTSVALSAAALYTAYVDKFGAPPVNGNIGIRVSIVEASTGERSVASSIRATVI